MILLALAIFGGSCTVSSSPRCWPPAPCWTRWWWSPWGPRRPRSQPRPSTWLRTSERSRRPRVCNTIRIYLQWVLHFAQTLLIDISKYSCSSSEVAGVLGQDNKCQSWKFYILHVCTLRVINFTQRITKWIQNTNPFTAYLTHFTYLHQVYKQDNKGLGDKMGEHIHGELESLSALNSYLKLKLSWSHQSNVKCVRH